ncbi:MAG: AAA family ATPase, partial [Pseudomonadota bacterium]
MVEAAEVEFGDGLTVVTGETGAGKSLLVDALLLLSGARADAGMVRSGCERAELAAEFDLSHALATRTWLAEQALEPDSRADRGDVQGQCRSAPGGVVRARLAAPQRHE